MNGVQVTAKEVTIDHGVLGKKIIKKRRKRCKRLWRYFEYI